jgi:hypothetical protein
VVLSKSHAFTHRRAADRTVSRGAATQKSVLSSGDMAPAKEHDEVGRTPLVW